jgi:hypothetical protein
MGVCDRYPEAPTPSRSSAITPARSDAFSRPFGATYANSPMTTSGTRIPTFPSPASRKVLSASGGRSRAK